MLRKAASSIACNALFAAVFHTAESSIASNAAGLSLDPAVHAAVLRTAFLMAQQHGRM